MSSSRRALRRDVRISTNAAGGAKSPKSPSAVVSVSLAVLLAFSPIAPGWPAMLDVSERIGVASDPLALVRSIVMQVQDRLRSDADSTDLYTLVDETVAPSFDFYAISRLVLGRHWKRVDSDQRRLVAEELRSRIVRIYAAALADDGDYEIAYLPNPDPVEGQRAVVRMEIRRVGTAPIPVSYRLYRDDESWKVYDVAIEGISMVLTYRKEFGNYVSKHGVDALIQRLETESDDLSG